MSRPARPKFGTKAAARPRATTAPLPVAPPWRTAYAAAIGTSHERSGTPCQDRAACRVVTGPDGREVLVAALADGAGSAGRAETGAELVVHSLMAAAADAVMSPGLHDIGPAFFQGWLTSIRATLAARAQADGAQFGDYASTALAAIIGTDTAVFAQIGDGAIVLSDGEGVPLTWVFWPQHGEFANQTCFVTQDDAAERLVFTRRDTASIREVALFSDGLERLILDLSTRTVHTPALRPILDWLATCDGPAPDPSPALEAYLASDHVNRRTDDDKSLIVATRALPTPTPPPLQK